MLRNFSSIVFLICSIFLPAHAESYRYGDPCFIDEAFFESPRYYSLKYRNSSDRFIQLMEEKGGVDAANRHENFDLVRQFLEDSDPPTILEKRLLATGHVYGCWGLREDETLAQNWWDALLNEGDPLAHAFEFAELGNEEPAKKRDLKKALKRIEPWQDDFLKRSAIALTNMYFHATRVDPEVYPRENDANFVSACGFAREALMSYPQLADAHGIRGACTYESDPVLSLAHEYAYEFLYGIGKQLTTIEVERDLDQQQINEALALFPILLDAQHHFAPDEQEKGRTPSKYAEIPRIMSTGSSFFISNEMVVTNEHVVNGASALTAVFQGIEYEAQVLVKDEALDAAVLRITGLPQQTTRCFSMGDAGAAAIGDQVYTAGFPLSDILDAEPKLTSGIVNSRNGLRGDPKFYQISAQIQPGNSGGPVFTEQGRLVGMATSTLRDTEDTTFQSVNFALKPSSINFLIGFLDDQPKCGNRFDPSWSGMEALPSVMALIRNYQ